MAATDYRIAGTGANSSEGFTNWTNPSRITTNDGLGASVTLGSGVEANNLLSGLHNVGIDLTSTIIGMEVKVDILVNQFDLVSVLLTTDSVFTKVSQFQTIAGGATGEVVLGGATDLWLGAFSTIGYVGFTAAEASTATFGAAIHPVAEAGTNTLTIDFVAIKLYISDAFDASPVPMLGGASC